MKGVKDRSNSQTDKQQEFSSHFPLSAYPVRKQTKQTLWGPGK